MTEEQLKKPEAESRSSEPPPPPSYDAPPPPPQPQSQSPPSHKESPPPQNPPPPPPSHQEPPKVVAEEKSVISQPSDDLKALALIEKPASEEKPLEGSQNRDAVLTRVVTEKRLSLIKAWEESEKSKAENKAHKKLSSISSWENRKKAIIEAELKKNEEELEMKKAELVEKMKNKIALIHKAAEERRAMIDAKKGEDLLKAEESAAKYRAAGTSPKKILNCF